MRDGEKDENATLHKTTSHMISNLERAIVNCKQPIAGVNMDTVCTILANSLSSNFSIQECQLTLGIIAQKLAEMEQTTKNV